jgi:hypothetical protein
MLLCPHLKAKRHCAERATTCFLHAQAQFENFTFYFSFLFREWKSQLHVRLQREASSRRLAEASAAEEEEAEEAIEVS